MKCISTIILILVTAQISFAQNFTKKNVAWYSVDSAFFADIEFYHFNTAVKPKGSLIYLTEAVTKKEIFDSSFQLFINQQKGLANVIKVTINPTLFEGVTPSNDSTGEVLLSGILKDVEANEPEIKLKNTILIGTNKYAGLLLNHYIQLNKNYERVALLFDNFLIDFAKYNKLIGEQKNLNGKLFWYVKSEKNDPDKAVELMNAIGLKSNGVIYKLEDVKENNSFNIFKEAINWLLVEGNNYIIKTDD